MHPNAQFRHKNRALLESLIDEIGFGMIFAATPDGPRVAHVPFAWTGTMGTGGAVHFHLSRGNALTKHLDGMTALIVINGPDNYVSPRYYENPAQVPTWNYLTIELEGQVRRMDPDGLLGHLETLTTRQEARIAEGKPWTLDKMPKAELHRMLDGIVGFELEVKAWRPTFKLSQNKPVEERERVAAGLEAEGSTAMAGLIRAFAENERAP
jgi:transcriptional regulator